MAAQTPSLQDLPDVITVQLSRPLETIASGEVTELKVREPTLSNLMTVQKEGHAGLDATTTMLELVVGLSTLELRKLPIRDFNALAGVLSDFLSAGQPISDSASPLSFG